jgi:hypothetical protein
MSLTKLVVVSVAWMLVVLAAALIAPVESLRAWFVVSVVAVGPSLTWMYFGRAVAPTTSQVIHDARR